MRRRARLRNLQIREKLFILIAVPLVLIVLLVGFFALLYGDTERGVAAVRQPRQAVQTSDNLRTALLDAETGMRGYVFTGNRAFMQPYVRARLLIEPSIAALESVAEAEPSQRRPVLDIGGRARTAFAAIERDVTLTDHGRRSEAVDEIKRGDQKRFMDRFRGAVTAYEERERDRQDQAVSQLDSLWYRGTWLIAAALLFGIAATAVLYFTISRNVAGRLQTLRANALAFARGVEPSALEGSQDEIKRVDDSLQEMFSLLDQRHELLARYELLAENAGDIMLFIDRDNRIVEANAAARRAYGYSRSEMTGRTFAELHAPSSLANMPAMLERARGHEATVFQTRHQRRNGATFEAEVALTAATSDGLIVAILRDTTARRLADAAISATFERTIEASRFKAEFVSTVSHELRTPMNAIIGMNELMLDTKLDEEQLEYARTMRESGHALLQIIDDVLDFSKIESGRMEIKPVDVNVAAMAESATALLAPGAQGKNLSLTTLVSPGVPHSVLADPVRLRQILVNLLSNAVKFTFSGGVALEVLLEAEDERSATLRFVVRDTGIGVDAVTRARLFEPFTQADASSMREHGGTGLGLSISRRLAELMGGTIAVDTTPGRGSTFTFTAAFVRSAGDGVDKTSLAGRYRALIVNDDAAATAVQQDYLSRWGIEHALAANAQEAFTLLAERAAIDGGYDFVIVNATTAEGNGIEFGRRIGTDERFGRTKLILVNSSSDRHVAKAALEAGFSSCVAAPVGQTQLFESIARAVREPRALLPPVENEKRAHAPRASVGDAHVLVVEDNLINVRLAMRQLEKLGHHAMSAANGKVALEMLAREPFDLVLMDCQMPVMDGFAATTAIRKLEERSGAHMPIVAMTANVRHEDRQSCFEVGMDDYLAKPVQIAVMRAALEKWLPAA